MCEWYVCESAPFWTPDSSLLMFPFINFHIPPLNEDLSHKALLIKSQVLGFFFFLSFKTSMQWPFCPSGDVFWVLRLMLEVKYSDWKTPVITFE